MRPAREDGGYTGGGGVAVGGGEEISCLLTRNLVSKGTVVQTKG